MSEVYRYFAKPWSHTHDFSDESLIELYNGESYGTPVKSLNGFALGKKWMNVTVAMWIQDIREGNLFKFELYGDPELPDWWLDSILKNVPQGSFQLR